MDDRKRYGRELVVEPYARITSHKITFSSVVFYKSLDGPFKNGQIQRNTIDAYHQVGPNAGNGGQNAKCTYYSLGLSHNSSQ